MTANTETKPAADFDKLIEEIAGSATDVTKAMPACKDDKGGKEKVADDKIVAAAAAGKKPGEAAVDGDGDEDDDEAGEEVGKSFEITFEDGSKGTAVDGTTLLKALADRAEKAETALTNVWTIVKSLQTEVATLRAAPKPRKSVVSIAEKTAPTEVNKSATDGLDVSTFLNKALEAQIAGRVTGLELTRAENAINKGAQPDADFVRRVVNK